jgi:hypothetical protein
VKDSNLPVLDARDAAAILAEVLARRPAYVPEVTPSRKGPSYALLKIFARYMELVTARLNQAPDKNLLAFLDTLAIDLIPAQSARARVVFTALPDSGDGRIEASTRLGAEVPGRPEPLSFETEHGLGLATARLQEVKTVWPARDEYADHSIELAGGRAVRLFEPRSPVPHELYLAHDALLAFTGEVTLNVRFELGNPGSAPLALEWQFWDGEIWQRFAEFDAPNGSRDGTEGLTRSGTVQLKAPCGKPLKRRVNGIEAYWIRARASGALSPDPARVSATIDRIQLQSEMNRSLFFRLLPVLQLAGQAEVVVSAKLAFAGHASPGVSSAHEFLVPDQAFADSLAVDVTNTVYPFGQQPRSGSTFYFTSKEIFAKRGATMFMRIDIVPVRAADPAKGETDLEAPVVAWEYWNGSEWTAIVPKSTPADAMRFKASGLLSLQVPGDMTPVEVNDTTSPWVRVRLLRGAYGVKREISYEGPAGDPGPFRFTIVETVPPALTSLRLGYTYRSPWEYPEHCVVYNDFQFEMRSDDVRRPGGFFPAFRPVADATPTLYLGFDRPLPNDLVRLYVGIEEDGVDASPLVWEAWDGASWRKLTVEDETADLTRPGLVSFVAPDVSERPEAPITGASGDRVNVRDALAAAVFRPGDRVVVQQETTTEMAIVRSVDGAAIRLETPLATTYGGGRVAHAALPRFGRPLDWVRARLKDDGAPTQSAVDAIAINATWAQQVQTLQNEVLGSGTGEPGQSVFFSQAPVLRGEAVEVRELEGARAAVELPILQDELRSRRLGDDVVRVVTDARLGRVTEVWVRWQSRPHLFFSGPDDRHYVVERARGRVIFGDGEHGRIPPTGPNSIVATSYRVGGGTAGNVPAGTITQLLGSAMIVESVTNPRGADGGAEGETIDAVKQRGPQRIRHLGCALSASDYEALAREASPGLAMARVLPATSVNGRPAPGSVTVIVVPQSANPQPQPSFELRRQVHDYLAARMPATLGAGRLAVIGPTYLAVGVFAAIVPRDLSDSSRVEALARDALQRFLHPLTGGADGNGWPFGRDVFLSDIAALLEGIDGVDFVGELELLRDDIPQGERVAVPPDRIVVAGSLHIEMQASES